MAYVNHVMRAVNLMLEAHVRYIYNNFLLTVHYTANSLIRSLMFAPIIAAESAKTGQNYKIFKLL